MVATPPPNPDFAAGMEAAAKKIDQLVKRWTGPIGKAALRKAAAAIREAAKTPPREKED